MEVPHLKPLSVMQREHSHALVLLPKQDADARVAGLQCWYHVDSWSRPAQQGCFNKISHTKKVMETLMLPVKVIIGGAGELGEGLTVHCPGPLQRSGLQCPATGHPVPCPSTGSRVCR